MLKKNLRLNVDIEIVTNLETFNTSIHVRHRFWIFQYILASDTKRKIKIY